MENENEFAQGYKQACQDFLFMLTDHKLDQLACVSTLKNTLIENVQAARAALSDNYPKKPATETSITPSSQTNIPLDEELIYQTSHHN